MIADGPVGRGMLDRQQCHDSTRMLIRLQADYIGLCELNASPSQAAKNYTDAGPVMMAQSCYDPEAAIGL